MDIKGNMDGIDTARVVRKQFNLPVVYLTGEAHGEVSIVGRRGKGTTVGLRIPLIRSREATNP